MAEVEASHRPGSQIVRDPDAFLGGKVADARAQISDGLHASDEAVEARSAARRAAWR
jgi:hypothetical protein